jgi:hypothetical protein
MTCITVTTQNDLDTALAGDKADCIHIESPQGIWLKISSVPDGKTVEVRDTASVTAWDSASVRASGSASVRASGSASVTAWDSASVRASGSASVTAWDSASVRASGSASVTAWDSASVTASGSASVRASGSASVTAWDSASVTASGSASVTASGSASVRASGSASVTASGSASVTAWGSASVTASGSASVTASGSASVTAWGSASVTASGSASVTASKYVSVHLHSARVKVRGGVLIDMTELDLTDLDIWLDYTGTQVVDGRAVLYKAVDADLNAGHCYRLTTYTVGQTMVCLDWRDDNDCGGGFHLSPTAAQATDYYDGAKRWLRCTAALADIRPIGEIGETAKCKVRELTVEAEVDIHDRNLTSTGEV